MIHSNTKLLNFSGLCKCVVRFLYCLLKLPDEIGAGNCKQSGKEVLLAQWVVDHILTAVLSCRGYPDKREPMLPIKHIPLNHYFCTSKLNLPSSKHSPAFRNKIHRQNRSESSTKTRSGRGVVGRYARHRVLSSVLPTSYPA